MCNSSTTPGSSSCAVDQNRLSGARSPAKSQTDAATTPPVRVTRAHLAQAGERFIA